MSTIQTLERQLAEANKTVAKLRRELHTAKTRTVTHGDFGVSKYDKTDVRLAVKKSSDFKIYHCNEFNVWDCLPGNCCSGRLDEARFVTLGNIFKLMQRGPIVMAYTLDEAKILHEAWGSLTLKLKIDEYEAQLKEM